MTDSLLPNFEVVDGVLPQVIADYINQRHPVAIVLIGFRLGPTGNPSDPFQMDVLLSQSLRLDGLARELRNLADMYEAEWLRTVPAKEV